MNQRMKMNESANNVSYHPNNDIDKLRKSIDDIISRKEKPKDYIIEYTQEDNSMEPKIKQGDKLIINKLINTYCEKNIFLIRTPYGSMIRNIKKDSDETMQLICTNANNEDFAADDVEIIGKVVENEF